MRSSMDDDDDAFPPPPPGTHERPLAFVKAALPMTNERRLFFMGKKFKLFFCSVLFRVLHNRGFSGVLLSLKKTPLNSSPAEERNSRLRKRATTQLTKHPSLRSERERRDVVFVFEFIVAVVCARRSAPRVLLVEDTQKQSRLRGARCRRWYVLHRKAHFTRNFFDLSRAKARRTKKVAMSASEKRTHPKKTRFPPRAKEATRTSRRGRVDGLSPRLRERFFVPLPSWRKNLKRG